MSDVRVTRLDLRRTIVFSLWFFLVGMTAKLFLWDEYLSWWVITAPFWSSFLFSVFTKTYNEDGTPR